MKHTAASSMVTGAVIAVPSPAVAVVAVPVTAAAAISPPPGRRDLFPFSVSSRKERPRRVFNEGGSAIAKSNRKCTNPFQLMYGPCRMKLRKVSVVPSKSTVFPPERCPGNAVPRT